MPRVKIGDAVTCAVPVPAYYSDYAGRPRQQFVPGMVGVVASVGVPPVWGNGPDAVLVDFEGARYGTSDHTVWRVALLPSNVRRV